MAFPILFYFLGVALFGAAVSITIASFHDGIREWVKNAFEYIVTAIEVKIDKIWVNSKKVFRIQATTQKGNKTTQHIEECHKDQLPQEVQDEMISNGSYKETLTMIN